MINRWITLLILVGICSGCVTKNVSSNNVPILETYGASVPDTEVLDVSVIVQPGISDIETSDNVFPEIRRAEATYIALQLSNELDDQGVWGATRVVPDTSHPSDLTIFGTILVSNGETLAIEITAKDSRGRVWLKDEYSDTTNDLVYQHKERLKRDPFQKLYRDIANDLISKFKRLESDERKAIRNVTKLMFARSFAPEAYRDYLSEDGDGFLTAEKLPARNDPMIKRIAAIQVRHDVFVDTLQGHYENFSQQMEAPYDQWRRLSLEETEDLRNLERESRTQLIAGGLSLLAGVAAATSDDRETRTAGAVGIYAGGNLIKSGLERRAEAKIHSLALEELGQSLEAEITPQVIELEDRTVQLSGTIEDQYSQWREILSDIYAAEIAELPTSLDQPSS